MDQNGLFGPKWPKWTDVDQSQIGPMSTELEGNGLNGPKYQNTALMWLNKSITTINVTLKFLDII